MDKEKTIVDKEKTIVDDKKTIMDKEKIILDKAYSQYVSVISLSTVSCCSLEFFFPISVDMLGVLKICQDM